MIEQLQGFPDNVLGFACHGHVTREDYDKVLVPRVEQALQSHDRIRLYYEVDKDFEGIDPGAAWEDVMVGIRHPMRWERFAIVTDVEWIRHAVRFFGFVIPGEFRVFAVADAGRAREWIVS